MAGVKMLETETGDKGVGPKPRDLSLDPPLPVLLLSFIDV